MIQIFAKKDTDQKAIMFCSAQQIDALRTSLNNTYGGEWVWIEKLSPFELIMFNDGLIYEGFHGKDERYAEGIRPMPLTGFSPIKKTTKM